MAGGFAYGLLTNWSRVGEGLSPLRGLNSFKGAELSRLKPEQRFLLLSDGSLTLELELLSGQPKKPARVEAVVEFRANCNLTDEAAAYLEEAPRKPAMHREVWLTAGGRLLVYAQTLIPLERIEKGLLNALEMESSVPLGRVLSARKIPVCKDRLEVAVLKCPKAAMDLGIGADTPLMARRYILFNRDSSGVWIIKAGITEVFSPGVIPAPRAK
ncbi:MAG: DUF98 domain-containing protein [Deltaproteobacteria bacterium]|nr:DUF98 domain-containing protein [Deltaproteobacteria bacterium]